MSQENRIIELLEELVRWTKVTSIPSVKGLLLETLGSPKERIAYHSSDGIRTSREVGRIANVSSSTISRWWKTWIRVGIAEPGSVKGGGERARLIFSLDDFGVEVPRIIVATSQDSGVREEET